LWVRKIWMHAGETCADWKKHQRSTPAWLLPSSYGACFSAA
jgi:hypothetical protein